MDERLAFVRDAHGDRFNMSELCARFGVSRRVGYKWIARFEAEGRPGLADRSRAPHHRPHRLADRLIELFIAERTAHPFWGARKLLAVLRKRHPRIASWPAPSTVADLLARRGLVKKRRTRRKPIHPGVVRPDTNAPNDLWTWKGLEDVEYATLEWVAWYNSQRLMEPLGYVPPAEYEEWYHRTQVDESALVLN